MGKWHWPGNQELSTPQKFSVMKKLVVFASFVLAALIGYAQKGQSFGESFKAKKSVSVDELKSNLDKEPEYTGVVSGTVKQVCKSEGCWLRLDDGSKDGILVKMKDHSFFVPKDIDGKKVYVKGTAKKSVTTVEMLKHYAEDAGKPKAEIDAITEPKTEIKMDAAGVIVL
jgi:hypothetical protein